MIQAIVDRRSIRKYKTQDVPRSILEEISNAGILAPSSKNRQPWKFIIVTGDSREDMLQVMEKGMQREEENPFLPESAKYLTGARQTLKIMRQAPAIIFILNTEGTDINSSWDVEERISEICNAQSIGAAIENMTLTATENGLGSLWICDTYFSYKELYDWLGAEGELYAAMAVGYADETPPARPRKKIQDVVEWRN